MTNPSPKARFLESNNNIASHRKLVDSPEYQRAIDFSLLQFGLTLSITQEEMQLGAAGLKMKAVHDFVLLLRYLSEAPQNAPVIARLDNLNHKA